MIVLSDVTHDIRVGSTADRIMSNVTARIPSDRRIALLGSKPLVKNALFDLLSGIILPSSGTITRYRSVSFPVGFTGGLSRELTARQNVEYVAKLYDQRPDQMVNFARTWLELGPAFDQPLTKLPGTAVRELAWVIAFCIPFDLYLVSASRKVTTHPSWFKFYELFKLRVATSGFIVRADPYFARLHCDMGMLLRNLRLELFEDLEAAIRIATETDDGSEEAEEENEEEPRPVNLFEVWF